MPPRSLTASRVSAPVLIATLAVMLSGCATPVSVRTMGLADSYRERTRSALDGPRLSSQTQSVLASQNLTDTWKKHPQQALATLRASTQAHFYTPDLPSQLFALAELNYQQARKTQDPASFMATALYAYAYLQPNAPAAERPTPYDTRVQQASALYMLGLTGAFGAPVNPDSQRWTLPFATLDLYAAPDARLWHGQTLSDFQPTARLKVSGLQNLYTTPGLGEPLAAIVSTDTPPNAAFTVTDKVRVPVNLNLNIADPRHQVLSNQITGRIVLTPIDQTTQFDTKPNQPPLQYDQTAARAISLSQPEIWSSEYKGFLDGRFFDSGRRSQLFAIEPHQHGRMPVVLIHGTASSPGRWADMVNDLLQDKDISNNFEFWFFSYATGNPIPYSALQLRRALKKALSDLGGPQADPALGQITLIGHSQGGLLAKMLTITPHDRLWNGLMKRPLSSLDLPERTRRFLEQALMPTAMPEIRQDIFISTPQHGSYLAGLSIAHFIGGLVTFPVSVKDMTQQIMAGNADAMKLDMSPGRLGSVYAMSPNSSFMRTLASIPVVPDVITHSIIPVQDDSPLSEADDGVVTYESAHIAGVRSELVVRHSSHSTQANPVTIAEVRRILLEQLADFHADFHPGGDVDRRNIVRIGGSYTPVSDTPPAHAP
ncbi:esterase/lipase family protein [Acetobacter papayae]|uniref:esterase/lipase family protein n=1 Tax=Acetobacter papayae TaxID=1076592 RepID=UPI0039E8222B